MSRPPIYGQVVVGPPGAGKTTFCTGMQQYLRLLGRDAWVVNLDPANERGASAAADGPNDDQGDKTGLPYETIFDVCEEAVELSSVMKQMELGPNGGLVYCMEYLEAHVDEIISKMKDRLTGKPYLLLDFPGQVELYTHSTCVQNLLAKMAKALDLRLTAVQLIDAQYCSDATKFISAALLGTTTMIRLELPAVNILSKVDLLSRYGELPLDFDFFAECNDLDRLLPFLENNPGAGGDDPFSEELDWVEDPDYQKARRKRQQSKQSRKHAKLHSALAEVVDDFGLLSFLPLDISSAESVGRVLAKIDKCNGYVFTESSINEDLFQCAITSDTNYEAVAGVRERLGAPESIKELATTRSKR